jgi:anti-sigma factor ChrR (cupin superfamily)
MSILPRCRDMTALITEDAEGALEGVPKVQFALHLSICTPCRRMRAQLRATAQVLRSLPKQAREPPKPSDVDAIMSRLAASGDERDDED